MHYDNLDPERREHAVNKIKLFFFGDLGLDILYQSNAVNVFYNPDLTAVLELRDPTRTPTWIDIEWRTNNPSIKKQVERKLDEIIKEARSKDA